MKYIFTYPFRLIFVTFICLLFGFFAVLIIIGYILWNFKFPEIKASLFEWDANTDFASWTGEYNPKYVYPTPFHWALKHPVK